AMPAYKLYYFPVRALGEVLRQVFKLAEVEFEDIRVAGDQWTEFKDKTPFGQMPVLEVDGNPLPGSSVSQRFISSSSGLAGKTPFEAAWVDALADQWKDFQNDFRNYWYLLMGYREGDAEKAKTEHGIPARDKFYPLIVKQLKDNGSGFLVGSSATWVDLLLADQTAAISKELPGFLDAYPEVSREGKMIMPTYKLYYFNARALGEVIRQVFKLAEVDFEDVRIERDDWEGIKDKTPFGQVPVLEVDDKPIPQSHAIARFVANQHGLAGHTNIEKAWVDAIADQWKDYYGEFKKYWYVLMGYVEGDAEKARIEHGIPARDKFYPLIVKLLKANGSGFLVGSSATWVDLLLADQTAAIRKELPGFLDAYPEVLAHADRIRSIPPIKKWIEERPET
ncbi:hypothetical protein PMAYCL1PPCAC_05293, partial [Pristionchus mayeri]